MISKIEYPKYQNHLSVEKEEELDYKDLRLSKLSFYRFSMVT